MNELFLVLVPRIIKTSGNRLIPSGIEKITHWDRVCFFLIDDDIEYDKNENFGPQIELDFSRKL